jgi:hypothetical protein
MASSKAVTDKVIVLLGGKSISVGDREYIFEKASPKMESLPKEDFSLNIAVLNNVQHIGAPRNPFSQKEGIL